MKMKMKELKKRFIVRFMTIVITTLVVSGVIVLARNPIGGLLHYGTCPNCGDSWWLNESGSIPYQPTRSLKKGEDYISEDILFVEITSGVMICKECLANPTGLNETKIENDLLDVGWPSEDANSVKEAVIRYKKEKLQN